MAPTADLTSPQTTITSPPNTAFNLKELLNTLPTEPTHEPSTETTPTRILLWLDNTPLLLEIPTNTPLTRTTTFTATAITTETTPADINDLLWGYLSNHMLVTDTEQIENEAHATANILPDAYKATKQAQDTITDARTLTTTIENDNTDLDGFHVEIEALTTHIDTIQTKLTTCQNTLETFTTALARKDIKDSTYNTTTDVIISNCEQASTTIEEIQNLLQTVTPDTLKRVFSSIRTQLDTLAAKLEQLTTRIENLYESATEESLYEN